MVAFGQVQDEIPAAVTGDAGAKGDQVSPDGGGARLRVPGPGADPRRPQQVVRHGGDDEPCGVRVEDARWQVSDGAAVQVGDDLLDDGVFSELGKLG